MLRLLMIADDFTGALDTGVQLAAHGIPTQVVVGQADLSACSSTVLVVDTETRHLLSLQMDQLCHLGTAHRFEGVDAEGAFVHRHTVDVVDAFFCGASDLREGRQKGQIACAACFEQGGKLCADVAAQGGIRLFIDAAHAVFHRAAGQLFNGLCSLCGFCQQNKKKIENVLVRAPSLVFVLSLCRIRRGNAPGASGKIVSF